MAGQQVSITLEKPWVGRPDGLWPCIVVGQHEVAQRFDTGPDGMIPGPSAEECYVRDIPGIAVNGHVPKPVGQTVYVFDAESEDRNTYVVDEFVATLWFGNWNYPETQPAGPGSSPLQTKGQELQRVVQIWGGWRYPKQVTPVRMLGELDMRPISPPPIPHVAVRLLDARGRPKTVNGKEWVYRPWDYFQFDSMCQSIVEPMQQAMGMPVQIVGPQMPDFNKLVEEAVARALAERSKERIAKMNAARAAKKAKVA